MSVTSPQVGGLTNLTRPAGDPAAIRAAAQEFIVANGGMQVRQRDLETLVATTVPEDWTGEAAEGFRNEAKTLLDKFPKGIEAFQRAAVALNTYADALEEAQARADRAIAAAGDLQEQAGRWERQWADGPPGDLSNAEANRLRASQAQDFQAEFSAVQNAVAGANEAAAAAADTARREFEAITASAPADPGLMGILNTINTVGSPAALGTVIRDLIVDARTGAAAARLTSLADSYERIVQPLLNAYGADHKMTRNAENLWRFMAGQRRTVGPATVFVENALEFIKGNRALGEAADIAAEATTKLGPLARGAGKVLLPISAFVDINTLVQGSDLPGGWGVLDQGIAATSLGATGVILLGAAGVALAPGIATAAVVVGGVSAAWTIGKWAVQNHEEIAEFMVDRWEDTTQFFEGVGDAATDFLQDPGGTMGKAADTVGDALEGLRDAGTDAWRGFQAAT